MKLSIYQSLTKKQVNLNAAQIYKNDEQIPWLQG